MGKMTWFEKQIELDIVDELAKKGELTGKQYCIACKEIRLRDRTAEWAVELAKAKAPVPA